MIIYNLLVKDDIVYLLNNNDGVKKMDCDENKESKHSFKDERLERLEDCLDSICEHVSKNDKNCEYRREDAIESMYHEAVLFVKAIDNYRNQEIAKDKVEECKKIINDIDKQTPNCC